jgi:hypothetical protein
MARPANLAARFAALHAALAAHEQALVDSALQAAHDREARAQEASQASQAAAHAAATQGGGSP